MGSRSKLMVMLLQVLLVGAILGHAAADLAGDKQALLDFIASVPHSRLLNWNKDSAVCQSWKGVTCSKDGSTVIALRLPGIGLQGSIPQNTLGRLSGIQILSLRMNSLSGPFPSDIFDLGNLTGLYLQDNNLSGVLPQDFSMWSNLTVLDLSNNGFNGSIPSSISKLTHLVSLDLANNSLSGEIPELNIPSLQQLNLADNNLSGKVPRSLLRFPSSAFRGNNLSTEVEPPTAAAAPVEPPLSPEPPVALPTGKSSSLSESAVLGIVLGGCVLGFIVAALLMVVCLAKPEGSPEMGKKTEKKEGSMKKKAAATDDQEKDNKITFFMGCSYAFNLEDLLRASAEVLGKGTFGTTYKAALEDGTVVVVKRLKDMHTPRRQFEQQMEAVGRMKHENVAPLRAYYCSKDEKLLICDYYSRGSLSSNLHDKREGRAPLDWKSRLQIAIGVARGVAYIHTQNSGKFYHGNLKASNVLLDSGGLACVSDIGLPTMINPITTRSTREVGYIAPEVTDTRKATQASDAYSFGVLLLEILTGKSPLQSTSSGETIHLVRWVQSVVREEWTAEVFDTRLLSYPNIEEEMVEMLRIGMACVDRVPDRRPKISVVVKMMEDIRGGGSNTNRQSSEIRSEGSTSPVIVRTGGVGSSSSSQTRVSSVASQAQTDLALQEQVNLAAVQTQVDSELQTTKSETQEDPAAAQSQQDSSPQTLETPAGEKSQADDLLQTKPNAVAVQSQADSALQAQVNTAAVQSQVDSSAMQQHANANPSAS